MGIFGFFGCKSKEKDSIAKTKTGIETRKRVEPISYEKQIEVFKSLGYKFADGVTKDLILTDGYAKSVWDEIRKERLQEIEQNPFSRLYYYFGWRNPEITGFNFSDKCIWFDLEFIDPSDQYIWVCLPLSKIILDLKKYLHQFLQLLKQILKFHQLKLKLNQEFFCNLILYHCKI